MRYWYQIEYENAENEMVESNRIVDDNREAAREVAHHFLDEWLDALHNNNSEKAGDMIRFVCVPQWVEEG